VHAKKQHAEGIKECDASQERRLLVCALGFVGTGCLGGFGIGKHLGKLLAEAVQSRSFVPHLLLYGFRI
jgi:hypothetical protein